MSDPTLALFKVRPAKGTLMPLQAADIFVTFAPSQLGEHSGVYHLDAHGLQTLAIKVEGVAPVMGGKKALTGGIDKTDADFAPKLNFVELDTNGQPIASLSTFMPDDTDGE